MTFDGFELPGFDATDSAATWGELRAEDTVVRYPILTAERVRELAEGLRRQRDAVLATRAVRDVVRAVDAATRILVDPGELREQALALLPATTRFSPPMVELILDRMAADWRADALERLLRVELGNPALLDRFVAEPGASRQVLALGPALTLNVFSGNVPGVAVTALVRCLLVKSAVLGKTAADDPVLPVLFTRALRRVDPELAACVAVTYWPGGSGDADDAALAEADTIVVYGGSEAVRSVRARASAGARVLEHGPRMSLGFVTREALTQAAAPALARDLALAAATFDQHGCVSLHGAFVERGGETAPAAFARMVHDELRLLEQSLPPGHLLAAEAAALHAERARVEFAGMNRGGFVLAQPAAGATVAYGEEPDATPSCLDRFVRISAVDDIPGALAALRPLQGLLQTAALAAREDRARDISADLARAGFTRITSFDAVPWPPAHWHHDGASPLRELIRWVDFENP